VKGSLRTLIRLQSWRVESRRRALADAVARTAALHRTLAGLEAEMLEEQAQARAAPHGAGLAYGRYAQAVAGRRAALTRTITDSEAAVAAARDELAAAHREQRTIEIAQRGRDRARAAEARRRERTVLDELGLESYRRAAAAKPRGGAR
jgi:flagellar export protein FliJ